jgi:succinate dehydrogenase hydrophobic anchor subunit
MTALADSPVNGAERAAKSQSPSAKPSSTGSSRNGLSEQSAVRVTGAAAVLITVVIALASFILSFSSLWNLAARSAWPTRLAWLWPVIVDGTIVLATMAIVALASYRHQRGNRRFFWAVLCAAAVVSVSGNAVHALIPGAAPLVPWLSAAIACVPPIALLATTHSLAILWRLRPDRPDPVTQIQAHWRLLFRGYRNGMRWRRPSMNAAC